MMHNKVLIVDDIKLNREILSGMLSDNYSILEAGDGKKALELIQQYQEDIVVVLLDLIMPDADGYTVLEAMKRQSLNNKIPVLVITAESNAIAERKCFEYGVSDFIHKPFDNFIVKKRVENIVALFQYKKDLEDKVKKQTETLKKQYKLLVQQADKLKESNTKIIDMLGTMVEYRNMESGEHIMRVKKFTRILAEQVMEDYPEYELTSSKIDVIVSASALHDIGKIAIPDSILLKSARLGEEEFECMKSHTIKGCEILSNIRDIWDEEYSKTSYEICRYHHERYDGEGYPDRLAGEEIPLSAQLVSLADVYDALVSKRVYKTAYSVSEAFRMIIDGECGSFSPKLVKCFWKVKDEFEALAKEQQKDIPEE